MKTFDLTELIFVSALSVIVVAICVAFSYCSYLEQQTAQTAIQAGLVQKITNSRVLWAQP